MASSNPDTEARPAMLNPSFKPLLLLNILFFFWASNEKKWAFDSIDGCFGFVQYAAFC